MNQRSSAMTDRNARRFVVSAGNPLAIRKRIHAPDYVEAVMQASDDPALDYSRWGMQQHGDTPPFRGMHEASLLTTGASLVAMDEVISGRARVAVNYAGGLHHAMRARASG